MKIEIQILPIGYNGLWELREQLNRVVLENFDVLYEGAIRLGHSLDEDYYAPRRIQINSTRLHAHLGLKYAAGHKYSNTAAPSCEQLMETAHNIQQLLDAAALDIPAPFQLTIVKSS